MTYKTEQQENVFINQGKTLATFFTLTQGKGEKLKIRYQVRAGKKGTGRILASEDCKFGARSQDTAMEKLRKTLNGIEFPDAYNLEKFEAAGYIPDPYAR